MNEIRKDIYSKLLSLSKDIKDIHISELHNQNELAEKTVKHNLLDFDYSKQRISYNILDYLFQIPDQINLRDSLKALFDGTLKNPSEDRLVSHTLYRDKTPAENFKLIITEREKIHNFLIFIIISSVSTNLIANFIPSQYVMVNLAPSTLSIKKTSIIISVFGFLISIFWLTYISQIGILSLIDTFGSFFGPLFGVMICDFYFIKKGTLNNKDIYSLENDGSYYYSGGWHIKGIYSLILGFIFAASTIWNSNLMFLQSFSWIIGAFVSGFVYYLLAKK